MTYCPKCGTYLNKLKDGTPFCQRCAERDPHHDSVEVLAGCPLFKCERGHYTGARKTGPDKPWEPQLPCYHCEIEEQRRAAARRRRESPRVLAGVDVDRAVAGLRKLPGLAELLGRRPIRVEVGHRSDRCANGRAWPLQRKIRVVGGPEATPARVLEVILHELCHLAAPPREHHGERFRRIFARAVREAWGIDVSIDVDRGEHKNRSYKMGEVAIAALAARVTAGEVGTYPPLLKLPKPTRPERNAELVQKRAAHAAEMLRRAERRLMIAKVWRSRWARRVKRYEREAARRVGK